MVMATKTSVIITDDLDGSSDAETRPRLLNRW